MCVLAALAALAALAVLAVFAVLAELAVLAVHDALEVLINLSCPLSFVLSVITESLRSPYSGSKKNLISLFSLSGSLSYYKDTSYDVLFFFSLSKIAHIVSHIDPCIILNANCLLTS